MKKKVFLLESDPAQLKPLRDRLKEFLKGSSLPHRSESAILVAVGEGATNAIRHAYQGEKGRTVRITLEDHKDKLVFRIRDYGRKIDLQKVQMPELPPKKGGGLGLYFMETMMDQVQYNTGHRRGNELILTKYKH